MFYFEGLNTPEVEVCCLTFEVESRRTKSMNVEGKIVRTEILNQDKGKVYSLYVKTAAYVDSTIIRQRIQLYQCIFVTVSKNKSTKNSSQLRMFD